MLSISSKILVPLSRTKKTPWLITFNGFADGKEHFALDFREPCASVHFVRIHSECITGDLLGSQKCDCGPQLGEALELMDKQSGLILYLRQEGRGIGLNKKMKAYGLQNNGIDTYEANLRLGEPADARDFGIAVDMLKILEVDAVRLMSNNPEKIKAIEKSSIDLVDIFRTGFYETSYNKAYLDAKVKKGHEMTSQVGGIKE
jgi:GTP cyclohydrolase II